MIWTVIHTCWIFSKDDYYLNDVRWWRRCQITLLWSGKLKIIEMSKYFAIFLLVCIYTKSITQQKDLLFVFEITSDFKIYESWRRRTDFTCPTLAQSLYDISIDLFLLFLVQVGGGVAHICDWQTICWLANYVICTLSMIIVETRESVFYFHLINFISL